MVETFSAVVEGGATVKFLCGIGLWVMMASSVFASADFDHQHELWNQQVARYVHWLPSGHDSLVDYTAWKNDRQGLTNYLKQLSSVSRESYEQWSQTQQLAFLVNAYNAFTVELVLDSYPDIDSIKEIGGWFRSPWSLKLFRLWGQSISLDDIEHGYLRQQGVFDDPRIHFAIVCASISCPPLSDRAYRPQVIDEQLEGATQRFLSDQQRNRYDAQLDQFFVSPIFKWFEGDFVGYMGTENLLDFFHRYQQQFGSRWLPEGIENEREATIDFMKYDWDLNDWGRRGSTGSD